MPPVNGLLPKRYTMGLPRALVLSNTSPLALALQCSEGKRGPQISSDCAGTLLTRICWLQLAHTITAAGTRYQQQLRSTRPVQLTHSPPLPGSP
jgi:hypothetical protein